MRYPDVERPSKKKRGPPYTTSVLTSKKGQHTAEKESKRGTSSRETAVCRKLHEQMMAVRNSISNKGDES